MKRLTRVQQQHRERLKSIVHRFAHDPVVAYCANDLKDHYQITRQCMNNLLVHLKRLGILAVEYRKLPKERYTTNYYTLQLPYDEALLRVQDKPNREWSSPSRPEWLTDEDLAWMTKYQQQAENRRVRIQHYQQNMTSTV